MKKTTSCSNCVWYRPHNHSFIKGLCIYKSTLRDRYCFVNSSHECKNFQPTDETSKSRRAEIQHQLNQFIENERIYKELSKCPIVD